MLFEFQRENAFKISLEKSCDELYPVRPTFCPLDFIPVCAIYPPCDAGLCRTKQFSNSCFACQNLDLATFTEGPCAEEEVWILIEETMLAEEEWNPFGMENEEFLI